MADAKQTCSNCSVRFICLVGDYFDSSASDDHIKRITQNYDDYAYVVQHIRKALGAKCQAFVPIE